MKQKYLEKLLERKRLCHILVFARYILPLLSALAVLVFGFTFSVKAKRGGDLLISNFRLIFETFKNAREGGASLRGVGVRNLYLIMVAGAVIFIVLYFISVVYAVFALCQLAFVARNKECNPEACRQRKILFVTYMPSRVFFVLSNFALLPLAAFPNYFSFIFSWLMPALVGTEILLNPALLVSLCLLVLAALLGIVLAPVERALKIDIFTPDEEGKLTSSILSDE